MSLFYRSLIIAGVILLAQVVGLAVTLVSQTDLFGQTQELPYALDALTSGVALMALGTAGVALIAFLISFVMGDGVSYLREMFSPRRRAQWYAVYLHPLKQVVINLLDKGTWFGLRDSDIDTGGRRKRY